MIALVTYPRAPARITETTSSAASETDSARNRTRSSTSAQPRSTSTQARSCTAPTSVHVEQHHVRQLLVDHGDRGRHVSSLTDHLQVGLELAAHPGADHPVVVHQNHS